jgi:nitrate reductase gamma subunit
MSTDPTSGWFWSLHRKLHSYRNGCSQIMDPTNRSITQTKTHTTMLQSIPVLQIKATKGILLAKIYFNLAKSHLVLALTFKILALYRNLVKSWEIDRAFRPRPTTSYG